MLSRVAENLYWMGRYVERAENTARIISVNGNLLLDLPKALAPGWSPLIAILGLHADFDVAVADERQVVRFLMGDCKNPGSILNSVHFARENCRTVRDILPREVWELLNELYLYAEEHLNTGISKRGRHDYLKRITRDSQLFIGKLASSLSRDQAYDFLRIGRYLERADMTSRTIDVRSANLLPTTVGEQNPFDTIQWISVLNSLSAHQVYRRHMQTQVRRAEVLQFLFRDPRFPRAFVHCLDRVEEGLGNLGHNNHKALALLRGLVSQVNLTAVEELDQAGLHQFIDGLQQQLIEVHASLAAAYFLSSKNP